MTCGAPDCTSPRQECGWSACSSPSSIGRCCAARACSCALLVEPSAAPAPERDIAAITYAANPAKKGLDRVLAAWRELRAARSDGDITGNGDGAAGELLVAGIDAAGLAHAAGGSPGAQDVRALGSLASADYRALLRRARVFVCAPRREDYGIAQLEALADGCMLVTTAAPGPYAALPIARSLDGRLVGEDLAAALASALHEPLPAYGQRALAALAPYRLEAVRRVVSEQLLPRLLGQRAQLRQ